MFQDLNCLIERYLEPLKEETFLSAEDIEALFGNIQEIVQFQKLFLQSLEAAVELDDVSVFSGAHQFKVSCSACLESGRADSWNEISLKDHLLSLSFLHFMLRNHPNYEAPLKGIAAVLSLVPCVVPY